MNSPILPHHPLNHPGVQRIVLDHDTAEVLESIGEHLLIIATRADSTAPKDQHGRMILHCLPCSKESLDGAYRVASGTHRAVKIKPAKP